jgi:hypothetical protein
MTPSKRSQKLSPEEKADWVERALLFGDNLSRLKKTPGILGEDGSNVVVEDGLIGVGLDGFEPQILARQKACGEMGLRYPFDIQPALGKPIQTGIQPDRIPRRLTPRSQWKSGLDTEATVYGFMLMATMENMSTRRMAQKVGKQWRIVAQKREDGGELVDAAQLFEKLCAEAIRGYLGPRCKSAHVGAGPGEKLAFPERFSKICAALGEGKARPRVRKDDEEVDAANASTPFQPQTSGDGGLDFVAWVDFAESLDASSNDNTGHGHCLNRPGKLVVFGQSKTGKSHDAADARRLDPTAFAEEFLLEPFATSSSNIMRVFMVAERPSVHRAAKFNRAGGLLMDRCRIMDCLNAGFRTNNRELWEEMNIWMNALIQKPATTE